MNQHFLVGFPFIGLLRSPLSLSLPLSSSAEYLFQLMAVLVHHGDMHSGHFVTYRRCPPSPRGSSPFSSQWLWVSDDSVRKASLHEVLSSNAYMLFYERVRRLNLALQPEEWSGDWGDLWPLPSQTLTALRASNKTVTNRWLRPCDSETRTSSHGLLRYYTFELTPSLIQFRKLSIPKMMDLQDS